MGANPGFGALWWGLGLCPHYWGSWSPCSPSLRHDPDPLEGENFVAYLANTIRYCKQLHIKPEQQRNTDAQHLQSIFLYTQFTNTRAKSWKTHRLQRPVLSQLRNRSKAHARELICKITTIFHKYVISIDVTSADYKLHINVHTYGRRITYNAN